MHGAHWRNRVGPPAVPLIAALLVTAIAPPTMSAGLRAGPPQIDCNGMPAASAARRAALGPVNPRAAMARAHGKLDKRGELTGRVLSVPGAGPPISISLPVESAVAAPSGSLIVYTRHTVASGSEVRAVDLSTGCDIRLAAPTEIVRSAVLDPSAAALYVHSVSRIGRADAGVARHDLASGAVTEALPPLRAPARLGPIFGTSLRFSIGGDALAVQSCGFAECLTRVLEISSGTISTLDAPRQGALVGLTKRHLVTLASCPGLPCPVLSTDLSSGAVIVLAEEGFEASLTASGGGYGRLRIRTVTGTLEIDQ